MANQQLPGVDLLGRGFNIFDPYDPVVVRRQPIFLMKLAPPTDPNGTTPGGSPANPVIYDIPMHVSAIPVNTSGGQHYAFADRRSYEEHLSTKTTLKASTPGSFSSSFSTSFAHDQAADSQSVYALYEFEVVRWELMLALSSGVESRNPEFVKDTEHLPTTYKPENLPDFIALFEKYGTHYIDTVRAGGQLQYTASATKTYTTDTKAVSRQIELEFQATFGSGSVTHEEAWKAVDQHWRQSRVAQMQVRGGNPTVLQGIAVPNPVDGQGEMGQPDLSAPFTAWLSSLGDGVAAAPIGFTLKPISDVFPKGQATAVDQAYLAYTTQKLEVQSKWEAASQIRVRHDFEPASSKPDRNKDPQMNADPYWAAAPDPLCVMHVLVLDRATLEVVHNKEYAPACVSYFQQTLDFSVFDRVCRDMERFRRDTGYILAIATSAWMHSFAPARDSDFYNLLVECGANRDRLDRWSSCASERTGMQEERMAYSLIGVCGTENTGVDALSLISVPAATCVKAVLVPCPFAEGGVIHSVVPIESQVG